MKPNKKDNRTRQYATPLFLHLNSRDEFTRIDISKIVYFEADGNYTTIVLSNQLQSVVCMNLSQMKQILSDMLKERANIFIRVGRKYIINHTYIYNINVLKQKLVLSDGEKFVFHLDISKEALKELREMLLLSVQVNKH